MDQDKYIFGLHEPYYSVWYAFAFREGYGFIDNSNFAHSELLKTLYTKWLFLFFSIGRSSLLPSRLCIHIQRRQCFIEHFNLTHSEILKTLNTKWLFLFSVFAGIAYYFVSYAFAFGEGTGFIGYSNFAHSKLLKTVYTKWLFLFF